jgi:hypothetical protein
VNAIVGRHHGYTLGSLPDPDIPGIGPEQVVVSDMSQDDVLIPEQLG